MNRKPTSRTKALLKFLIKLTISGVALYFVFKKVDFHETLSTIGDINLFYFIGAILVFNASKLVSTFRLKALLQDLDIFLTNQFNIKLYYIGAFYNIFLPGSISGDGYKVYLIKEAKGGKIRELISAVLLDRLNGLAALLFLTGFLVLFSSLEWTVVVVGISIGATVLVFPGYYITLRLLFKKFLPSFFATSYLSIGTQLLQVACAVLILKALPTPGLMNDYLALFMVSSVVAVIPFTIGGLGAREVVFITGYQYLQIDEHTAISFTLLFFGITAISAFIGLFLTFSKLK